ncbi:Hsp20/alpha crystallin family protein [Bacillus solimangrovi]|uniref:SHSP domain-containing protein n=1 Tax=Bacillus solimangrovi TaxID=1305675 RepID=A0A1E5LH54_9BACI|nr:Hsp20/alpha crystallin family protein [Bacillus solimangrovi]OEH93409.1 hypothetical protein BFG57_12215 [Bacillus solimangrovi]
MFDPFKQFQDFQKQFDGFFNENFTNRFDELMKMQTFPPTNIYRTEHELIVLLSIPGLKSMEQLDISVTNNNIVVSGNLKWVYQGFQSVQKEIYSGEFERTIPLPYAVKEDRIEASYHKGLVIIHLYKLIPDTISNKKIDVTYIEDE